MENMQMAGDRISGPGPLHGDELNRACRNPARGAPTAEFDDAVIIHPNLIDLDPYRPEDLSDKGWRLAILDSEGAHETAYSMKPAVPGLREDGWDTLCPSKVRRQSLSWLVRFL